MRIGVLSDTHGEIWPVRLAVDILEDMKVDLVIHCGDIGAGVPPLLRGIRTHFVHGNMDDPDRIREMLTDPKHTFHNEFGCLEIAGRRVAFLHGDDVKLLHHTIHGGHWDLVCHGHTHAFSSHREGQTLVLNPGALARTKRPSLAVVDLDTLEVTEVTL